MHDIKPFLGQLARLSFIVVAILGGRFVINRLPMVEALGSLPGVGVSARDLVTALAYLSILVLLVSFAKSIEAVVDTRPGGLPWQSLVAQGFILAGIVLAYRSLDSFAVALLGRYHWAYSVALLLLAVVPIVGVGKLLYEYLSNWIEQWED